MQLITSGGARFPLTTVGASTCSEMSLQHTSTGSRIQDVKFGNAAAFTLFCVCAFNVLSSIN